MKKTQIYASLMLTLICSVALIAILFSGCSDKRNEQMKSYILDYANDKINSSWLEDSPLVTDIVVEEVTIKEVETIDEISRVYDVKTILKGYYKLSSSSDPKLETKFKLDEKFRLHQSEKNGPYIVELLKY